MSALYAYALIAAVVCALVSFMELLDRYANSAKILTLVWNVPAIIYLAINPLVGAAAIYVSNSTNMIDFHLNDEVGIKGILMAIGVGLGGLGILRSNFATLTGGQKDVVIGPSAILEKLKEYLDKRIDKEHKRGIDKDIRDIMREVDPNKARYDLHLLCLAGTNRCTQKDIDDLNATIKGLFDPQLKLHRITRGMLMGHAIYKLVGVDVLRSAVEQLEDVIRVDSQALENDREEDEDEILNQELQKALDKLSEKEK